MMIMFRTLLLLIITIKNSGLMLKVKEKIILVFLTLMSTIKLFKALKKKQTFLMTSSLRYFQILMKQVLLSKLKLTQIPLTILKYLKTVFLNYYRVLMKIKPPGQMIFQANIIKSVLKNSVRYLLFYTKLL